MKLKRLTRPSQCIDNVMLQYLNDIAVGRMGPNVCMLRDDKSPFTEAKVAVTDLISHLGQLPHVFQDIKRYQTPYERVIIEYYIPEKVHYISIMIDYVANAVLFLDPKGNPIDPKLVEAVRAQLPANMKMYATGHVQQALKDGINCGIYEHINLSKLTDTKISFQDLLNNRVAVFPACTQQKLNEYRKEVVQVLAHKLDIRSFLDESGVEVVERGPLPTEKVADAARDLLERVKVFAVGYYNDSGQALSRFYREVLSDDSSVYALDNILNKADQRVPDEVKKILREKAMAPLVDWEYDKFAALVREEMHKVSAPLRQDPKVERKAEPPKAAAKAEEKAEEGFEDFVMLEVGPDTKELPNKRPDKRSGFFSFKKGDANPVPPVGKKDTFGFKK